MLERLWVVLEVCMNRNMLFLGLIVIALLFSCGGATPITGVTLVESSGSAVLSWDEVSDGTVTISYGPVGEDLVVYTGDISSTGATITGIPAGVEYIFKIVLTDKSGTIVSTKQERFTIKNASAIPCIISAPVITGKAVEIITRRPVWYIKSATSTAVEDTRSKIRILIDEEDWTSLSVVEKDLPSFGSLYTYFCPTDLTDGEHFIYVQEQDSNGNWSATTTFKTLVAVDKAVPPLVELVDAVEVDGTFYTSSSSPTIKLTSTGENFVKFKYYDLESTPASHYSDDGVTPFEVILDLSSKSDGSYSMDVYEVNSDAKESLVNTFTFVYDSTAPLLTFTNYGDVLGTPGENGVTTLVPLNSDLSEYDWGVRSVDDNFVNLPIVVDYLTEADGTTAVDASSEKDISIKYSCEDNLGNAVEATRTFKVVDIASKFSVAPTCDFPQGGVDIPMVATASSSDLDEFKNQIQYSWEVMAGEKGSSAIAESGKSVLLAGNLEKTFSISYDPWPVALELNKEVKLHLYYIKAIDEDLSGYNDVVEVFKSGTFDLLPKLPKVIDFDTNFETNLDHYNSTDDAGKIKLETNFYWGNWEETGGSGLTNRQNCSPFYFSGTTNYLLDNNVTPYAAIKASTSGVGGTGCLKTEAVTPGGGLPGTDDGFEVFYSYFTFQYRLVAGQKYRFSFNMWISGKDSSGDITYGGDSYKDRTVLGDIELANGYTSYFSPNSMPSDDKIWIWYDDGNSGYTGSLKRQLTKIWLTPSLDITINGDYNSSSQDVALEIRNRNEKGYGMNQDYGEVFYDNFKIEYIN